MIITKKEFDYIKTKKNGTFSLKVDFGTTTVEVLKKDNKAILADKFTLSLEEKIKENFCYLLDKEGIKKIAFFSSDTNRFYKLTPTPDWPTISLGSVPMHRLSSPKKDTQNKINFLKPEGIILDTCMGLGYTAILASQTAKEVITFERDENVVFLAGLNPLSKVLFSSPRIKIRKEDIFVGVKEFENNYFDCIIHDPPTFKLSPEVYSLSFYQQLFRILKPRGELFHYTPLYKIKRGFDFPSKIRNKLKEAGFEIIRYSEDAGGVLCKK